MKSLTNILKAAKIYDPKLDPQIKLAERLQKMMKLYHQQLRTLGLMKEEATDDEDLMMTFLNGIGK